MVSVCDRATVAVTTILQIIADAELEAELAPGELQYRLWRRLCEDIGDMAREIAAEHEVRDA